MSEGLGFPSSLGITLISLWFHASHRQFGMSHTLRADTQYSEIVQNVHDNPHLRHKHFLFPARVFNKAILFQANSQNMTKHMLWKTTYNKVISFYCTKEKKMHPKSFFI